MLEVVVAVLITLAVLAVVIPVALGILLWRQVSRSRWGGWLLMALGGRRRPVRAGRRGAPPTFPALRRHWAQLAHDASAAGARFYSAAASIPEGPLHAALADARNEVETAVAEAHRLAVQGDRTERAHRDILAALDVQRRRRRTAGPADLESALAAATRAQHESAERLGAASRAQLCQLQIVVARLHGLTAHALELATMDRTPQLTAVTSLGDRLAALRMATAEIETATTI